MRVNITPRLIEFVATEGVDVEALYGFAALFLANGYGEASMTKTDEVFRCACDGPAAWARLAPALEAGVLVGNVTSVVYADDAANLPQPCKKASPF